LQFQIIVPGAIDKYPAVARGTRVLIERGGFSHETKVFKVAGINVHLEADTNEFKEQIFNNDLTKAVLCNVQFLMNWCLSYQTFSPSLTVGQNKPECFSVVTFSGQSNIMGKAGVFLSGALMVPRTVVGS
jgi:hypothetical protein